MSAPEIVAVLVVMADGDPGGLLAPGRCGARPPEVIEIQDARRSASSRWEIGSAHGTPGRPLGTSLWARALPLWWDGALVPEGYDRARRLVWSARAAIPTALHAALFEFAPTLAAAEWLAVELIRAGPGLRVVRLARVDGRLVEVEP